MTNKTIILAALLLASASAALAQNSPTSRPLPGLDNFSLPSSRPTPQRVPEAEPTVRPTASAMPRPVAPPAVVPTVRATPTPRPSPNASRPTPSRPVAGTISVASPRPATSPTVVPQPTPTAEAVPPSPVALSTPVVPVSQPAAPREPADTMPLWVWVMLACLPLAIAAGTFGWWWPRLSRRRYENRADGPDREILVLTRDDAESVAISAAPPAPAPLPPAGPLAFAPETNASVPAASATRATLDLELIPNRAGIDPDGLNVDYLIVVRNTGAAAANNIRLDVRLLCAGTSQDAVIAALFATPIAKPIVPAFDLAAGSTIELGGSGTHPRETLEAVTIAGQAAVVPVLAINVEYDWAGGRGQTAHSYVIGIARGAEAKLQPFPLGVARMHESVSAIDYTVNAVS